MRKKFEQEEKLFATGEITITKGVHEKGVSENGTFTFIASGIKEDRYGEIVDPSGWDFKAFKKNPVMLWGHNHSIPAIARVTKIWKDEKQVYAEAEWAPTPFAQEIRQLVEAGFIGAVSVGFIPREWEGEWPNYKFIDQELLEISVVNVPAYAEALITEAKSMGLNEVLKSLEDVEEPQKLTKDESPVQWLEINDSTNKIILHRQSGKREVFDLVENYGKDLQKALKNKYCTEKRLEGIEETLKALPEIAEAVKALVIKQQEVGRSKAAEESKLEAVKVAGKAIEIALKQYREDKNVSN